MTVGSTVGSDPAMAAAGCADLGSLATAIAACTSCAELAATRNRTVAGTFPSASRLLLVGEAPGAAEDTGGQPFAGRSGQLLDELLAEVGVAREHLAVANVLKCRPPGNRTPRRAEVAACRPWLTRQLALHAPRVVLALGGTAAAWFLGPGARIGAARGQVHPRDGFDLLVTYHPSAALRFGPNGAPRAGLRADLARAVELAAVRK